MNLAFSTATGQGSESLFASSFASVQGSAANPTRHDIIFLASSKYPKHPELPDNSAFVSNVPLNPVCFSPLSKEEDVGLCVFSTIFLMYPS